MRSRGAQTATVSPTRSLGARRKSLHVDLGSATTATSAALNVQSFEQKIDAAFLSVDEDGTFSMTALLDSASLARWQGGSLALEDWKGLCKVVKEIIKARTGISFIAHDARTAPKKYAHCSRYMCALRASHRTAEHKRRRNNQKLLKYDCRGTLSCSILHGYREMFVSIVHIDHDVCGLSAVPPLQETSSRQGTPSHEHASTSASVEEDMRPAIKRMKLEATDTPGPAFASPFPAAPMPRAPMQAMPTAEMLAMQYSPGLHQVPHPAMDAFAAPANALPPHLMQSPMPAPFIVSPAPPLLDRPLSSMSGFAAESERHAQQETETLLAEATEVVRSGRALQPVLDDFLTSARRLVEAARRAEESDRQAIARHLDAAAAAAAAAPPAVLQTPFVEHQPPFIDHGALQLDVGAPVLGLDLSMWRRMMQL